MPDSKVVDAWALLAWVRDEQPAAGSVRRTLQEAEDGNVLLFMSWINAGEVYYMLARKHPPKKPDEFLTRLPSLPIQLALPSEEDIIAAAKLKSAHRLSYADAFAAALAVKENADPYYRRFGDARTWGRAHGGVDRPTTGPRLACHLVRSTAKAVGR